MTKHLIIGSGAAGLSALRQIRALRGKDTIKVVTAEKVLPYAPMALPYLISGKIEEAALWSVDEAYLKTLQCQFDPGKRVIHILPMEKAVVYESGDREEYDTLLIATGSVPNSSSFPGSEEVRPLRFHHLNDFYELMKHIRKDAGVFIYGGGLIAMGLGASLIQRGCKVRLAVRSRILRRYFDQGVGRLIAQAFRNHGSEIIEGSSILRAKKVGEEIEVILSDGSSKHADTLICCTGTRPNLSFLAGSGIRVNEGILVDTRLRTSGPEMYAAGDVAEAMGFFDGKPGLNAIWPSAVEQGEIAGYNMAGEIREYQGWVSMNIFHFFGNMACSMGLTEDAVGVTFMKEEGKEWLKALCLKEGRLVGAQFMNVPVDPGVFLSLIKNRTPVRDHIELLMEKPVEASRWLMTRQEGGL